MSEHVTSPPRVRRMEVAEPRDEVTVSPSQSQDEGVRAHYQGVGKNAIEASRGGGASL